MSRALAIVTGILCVLWLLSRRRSVGHVTARISGADVEPGIDVGVWSVPDWAE